TVLGANPFTVQCGSGSYSDPGATADDEGNNITAQIIVTGLPVNTTVPGTTVVTYEVTDDVGTITTETRDVVVEDTLKPVLTVLGDNPLGLEIGDTFTDPGVSVADQCDSTIIPVVTGLVDVNTPGNYLLSYDAQDDSGNPADTVTRTVAVVAEFLNFSDLTADVVTYVDVPAFPISATLNGGANITTYEWREATRGVVASGSVAGSVVSYNVTPGNGVGQYPVGSYTFTLSVSDDTGTTTSSPIHVSIYNRLSVVDDIESAQVVIGDTHQLTFDVAGGIPTVEYQWQVSDPVAKFDGQDLTDTGNVSGSNTPTLTITNFTALNDGAYQCVVNDAGTEVLTSSAAILTAVTGVPVGGIAGLAGLAALSALSGMAAIRRRRK
ncbi:MAG: DUF5011 domain-containing protein, partial [Candidatus Hydrogenedentes bacterium]|nr:DUF5011 domain-containing protein [Candidatus Hydrogenedentota bacterium]